MVVLEASFVVLFPRPQLTQWCKATQREDATHFPRNPRPQTPNQTLGTPNPKPQHALGAPFP